MHYFKHLVFILIFASASLLKANEEASVTVVPFELFAEPSTYVDGVNVASGHFTYSVTDAKISGPCSVAITRNYVQGHTGSLGANWDLNCFGEINIHPLSLTTNVKKGPFTGLSYLRDRKSNALKLDPIAFKRGLTNAQGKINGQTNLKNIQLELLQDYSFLYLQTGAKKRLVYEPTSKPLNFTLVCEEFADGFKNFFKDSQYWSEAPSGLKQQLMKLARS